MSSNQDSTEPWDCISRISEDTPSLSSSWQDLGERPEEPESQAAETEGNQQSHETDTESDVGGVRGPQVQSNHIQNPFRVCGVQVILCLCERSFEEQRPPKDYHIIRLNPELRLAADLFMNGRFGDEQLEKTIHYFRSLRQSLERFIRNSSYDSVSFYCCVAAIERRGESVARGW
ncbi:hypothetical protein FOVSG1_003446 [Fusarium oxysporum f. sp. vasinfectum]